MEYKFRGRTFDEFEVGEEFVTASRTVTEADVMAFAGVSGDFNPLHTDETFMAKSSFGTRIAHGMLVMAIATGLANQKGDFEGTTIAVLNMNIVYKGAVKAGDTIRLKLVVGEKKESSKPDRGIITFNNEVLNQNNEVVIETQWIIMMSRKQ
jgi:acyl dehydratase